MSHHNCEYLVFRCMDFRIKPSVLSKLLAQEGCGEGCYDLVSLAGSAKDLLGNASERDNLIKQVTLSQSLHGISKILVLYHNNCGAYGIADPEAERKQQQADLLNIKKIIQERFPELVTVAYIIKGVGADEMSLEKIY